MAQTGPTSVVAKFFLSCTRSCLSLLVLVLQLLLQYLVLCLHLFDWLICHPLVKCLLEFTTSTFQGFLNSWSIRAALLSVVCFSSDTRKQVSVQKVSWRKLLRCLLPSGWRVPFRLDAAAASSCVKTTFTFSCVTVCSAMRLESVPAMAFVEHKSLGTACSNSTPGNYSWYSH